MRRAKLFRFYNEAVSGSLKNLGSGFRTVIALPPGRKWITLVEWTTLDTAKILVKDWERMKPEPVEFRLHVIMEAMKQRLPCKFEDGKPTGAIKEAIAMIRRAS